MDNLNTLLKLQKAVGAFLDSPRCVLEVNVSQQDFDSVERILRGLPPALQVYKCDRDSGRITVKRTDISKQYKGMMNPLVVDLTEEA
ncbi:MAG TPA: hypothetical protein DEP00_01310 [Lachnospiraceae bacterium]|nr:hypothetical protein [Lachnospiraceae bacterium]